MAHGQIEKDVENLSGYGSTDDPKKTPSAGKLLVRRNTFNEGEQDHKTKFSTWTIDQDEESMGDISIVINLLADLTPAGVLPLASGMVGTGYVPSFVLLLLFAGCAAYMMFLISRTMEITGAKSHDKIWEKCVGYASSWVPLAVLMSVCFGNCLAYSCMFGDLFSGCMPGFGLSFATRTVCILGLSIFPLLPLCMLKDLSALAPTSFGALIAVLYMCVMMGIRYFDGSYFPGGIYHTEPKWNDHTWNFGIQTLLLVNTLAVGFLCHYNGCKYYREYVDHRPTKFGGRVGLAFMTVAAIFVASGLFGYATFGTDSSGVILNNYSSDDFLANIARLGMGFANVFSFPLMFSGLRESTCALLSFLYPENQDTYDTVLFQNSLSIVMLAAVTVLAVIVTDASTVVGLVGSICGIGIIYVIPCFLFVQASETFLSQGDSSVNPKELLLVKTIGFVGLVLMPAGACATLLL